MLSRTIKVNEKDYTFINAYRKNRSGFVHECELHIGAQVFDAKCQYYNRTWECYRFQSVMLSALYNYKKYIEKHLKEKLLNDRGYKRMTPSLKTEFDVMCIGNQELKNIADVRKELDHSEWF